MGGFQAGFCRAHKPERAARARAVTLGSVGSPAREDSASRRRGVTQPSPQAEPLHTRSVPADEDGTLALPALTLTRQANNRRARVEHFG